MEEWVKLVHPRSLLDKTSFRLDQPHPFLLLRSEGVFVLFPHFLEKPRRGVAKNLFSAFPLPDHEAIILRPPLQARRTNGRIVLGARTAGSVNCDHHHIPAKRLNHVGKIFPNMLALGAGGGFQQDIIQAVPTNLEECSKFGTLSITFSPFAYNLAG